MKFDGKAIAALRESVKSRLSEKRFNHTLGVENMAVRIGLSCLTDSISELRIAALLHDISKEYSEAEYIDLMKRHGFAMSDEDLSTPALWHSLTAPLVIKEDYPNYATPNVLSAVYNHTVGSPDMSVFDEIILLSDYIEEGRTYGNCVRLREEFLLELDRADGSDECILALHRAVARSLDNNINEFVSRSKSFHSRTKLTRDAIMAKTERQNNGSN